MNIIRIKAAGEAPHGAHWNYGPQYMREIGKRTARALCGMYPLPKIGYETLVRRGLGQSRLYVQNVGGDYYIASPSDPISAWPEVFGVEMVA